ncbi:MAG: DUF3187 family protein [Nitrospirae bacterium]|nr:DUF3187 family protein [Nitrospirota bacterium]
MDLCMIRKALLCHLILISFPLAAYAEEAHSCSANVGYGPLNIRGQSPFQMLHLSLTPSAPSTLHREKWEAQILTTWVNRWNISEGRYFIDNETLRMATRVKYGLTEYLQVGIEVPVLWRGGGIMDGGIDWWHKTFGLDRAGRNEFPKNRFRVEFDHKDGSKFVLDEDDAGVGLQDTVLSSQITLTCGGASRPAAALGFSVSLPTGGDEKLFGSGGSDLNVALILAKRVGNFYLYLNGGYTRFDTNEIGGVELKKDQWTLFTGLEYRIWKKTSLILQNLINSAVAKDFFEFSEYTDEISWGIKSEFSPGWMIEFAAIENIINFKNSPDFGVHAGVSYRF